MECVAQLYVKQVFVFVDGLKLSMFDIEFFRITFVSLFLDDGTLRMLCIVTSKN